MKVKEIIEKLKGYNQEANFNVIAENKKQPFDICIGSSDGCTNENCENISIYLKNLNSGERRNKNAE